MQELINDNILKLLPNIAGVSVGSFSEEVRKLKEVHKNASIIDGKTTDNNNAPAVEQIESYSFEKIGRNNPCHCGAKKSDGTPIKYKHCHGKN